MTQPIKLTRKKKKREIPKLLPTPKVWSFFLQNCETHLAFQGGLYKMINIVDPQLFTLGILYKIMDLQIV